MLGFTPTIIASESMAPTLNPGDITFVVTTSPGTVRIGDIIQYQTQDMMLIHRVIAIQESGGYLWFTTKGDANTGPDDPISQRQVIGKAVFTIPEVGWAAIVFKNFMYDIFSSSSSMFSQAAEQLGVWTAAYGIYVAVVLALLIFIYMLFTQKHVRKEAET